MMESNAASASVPITEERVSVPDDARMKALVERWGSALWRLAGSFEFNPMHREDLFQNMLIAIWQALPQLEDPARLKAYAFRIARNQAISHVARQARRPRREALVEETVAAASGPCNEAEQSERQRQLRRAVHALPLAQREAITLFLEGFSHAQIAEVLEVSENNVAVRISRARTALTKRLSL